MQFAAMWSFGRSLKPRGEAVPPGSPGESGLDLPNLPECGSTKMWSARCAKGVRTRTATAALASIRIITPFTLVCFGLRSGSMSWNAIQDATACSRSTIAKVAKSEVARAGA